jgi:hypothetical protein
MGNVNCNFTLKELPAYFPAWEVMFIVYKGEEAQAGDEGKIVHLKKRLIHGLVPRLAPRTECPYDDI